MTLNKDPIAIRFEDLTPGTCIVSPTPREVSGVRFEAARMLEIMGQSTQLDEAGKPLVQIMMGRAVGQVKGSDVVIDSSHLPRWEQILLPVNSQRERLRRMILDGAKSPWEERNGKLR